MTNFTVADATCIACGQCVRDCLPGALQMQDERPVMADEARCMRCLHCLAVCPTGAVSMLGHSPEQSTPLKGRWPTPEQVGALIKGRRSVRRYKQENVDPALLRQVLDVTAHAPTGTNSRKLLVTVIDDKAVMDAFRREVYERLDAKKKAGTLPDMHRRDFFELAPLLWREKGRDMIFRNAPHAVLVSCDKQASCVDQDPLIYLSYYELAAQSAGLGTLWCGLLYWALQLMLPELLPRVGIPDTHQLGYAMLFGYPDVHYARTVERGPAEVHRLRWPAGAGQ